VDHGLQQRSYIFTVQDTDLDIVDNICSKIYKKNSTEMKSPPPPSVGQRVQKYQLYLQLYFIYRFILPRKTLTVCAWVLCEHKINSKDNSKKKSSLNNLADFLSVSSQNIFFMFAACH
jgi:hypothetical protein